MFNCLILCVCVCVFNPQDIQPEESANRERLLTGELWPFVQVHKLKYVYFL